MGERGKYSGHAVIKIAREHGWRKRTEGLDHSWVHETYGSVREARYGYGPWLHEWPDGTKGKVYDRLVDAVFALSQQAVDAALTGAEPRPANEDAETLAKALYDTDPEYGDREKWVEYEEQPGSTRDRFRQRAQRIIAASLNAGRPAVPRTEQT